MGTRDREYRYDKVIRAREDTESGIDDGVAAPVPCGPRAFLWQQWSREDGGEWELVGTVCIAEEQDPEPTQPELTPGRIMRAFEQIPLPDSRLVIQPPGGATLVNFDTILSTQAEPFSETIQLLGRQVDFDITPSSFTFTHGDGSRQTTDWPGRGWSEATPVTEDDYIVHRYAKAPTTVHASVDTTWSARFRVDGGQWRPVPGTVTMAGDPVPLEVREAAPALVAGD